MGGRKNVYFTTDYQVSSSLYNIVNYSCGFHDRVVEFFPMQENHEKIEEKSGV